MAFREIAGRKNYLKAKDFDEDEVMTEGIYLGEIHSRFGVQFEFEREDGEIDVLNGSGLLKYKMQFIEKGDYVRVIYEGQITLESGPMKGRPAHQYKVLLDDERSESDSSRKPSRDYATPDEYYDSDESDDLDDLDDLDDFDDIDEDGLLDGFDEI